MGGWGTSAAASRFIALITRIIPFSFLYTGRSITTKNASREDRPIDWPKYGQYSI